MRSKTGTWSISGSAFRCLLIVAVVQSWSAVFLLYPLWAEEPLPCSEGGDCAKVIVQPEQPVPEVTYEQFIALREAKQDFVLVDARSKEAYDGGHIEGAVSFPLDEITREAAGQKFSSNKKIIVYCGSASCHISRRAAQLLISYGYSVQDYVGGISEWMTQGQPLAKSEQK